MSLLNESRRISTSSPPLSPPPDEPLNECSKLKKQFHGSGPHVIGQLLLLFVFGTAAC